MSNEYQGGYTRRQELTCTEAQIATYADIVLHLNEKIYVRMNSGVIRMKLGDGVTGLRDLPYTKVYDGTLEEVEAMLDTRLMDISGVLVSPEEPTNPDVSVWIDPDENEGENFLTESDIAQGLGDRPDMVLSQKAAKDAIEEVNGEVDDLKTKLGKTKNLFNKDEIIKEYYYSVIIGNEFTLKPNNQYGAFVIDAKPNTTYSVSSNDFSIGEIDENNVVLGTRSIPTFTTHENTRKLAISIYLQNIDNYMIVEGDTIPEQYEPYREIYDFAIKEKIYEVGPDKKYTSFTECLKSLAGDESQKIIKVYDGIYNIFEEIGGSAFSQSIVDGTNWRDVSMIVPPNTKIVGIGNVVFEFLPSAEEIGSVASTLLSPLNISGSVEIENIKIHAENCRYCIHDETSSLPQYDNVTRFYKNVECVKYNGTLGNRQAFACGFQRGTKFNFENCVFISERGNAFSMHNSSTGGASINIDNCVFITKANEQPLELINVSGNQVRNIVNLSNSYFERQGTGNQIVVSGGSVNTFDITLIGCTDIGDVTINIDGNIYPIKQYNKR